MTISTWIWILIPIALLIGLYIYAFRRFQKQKEQFDVQYNTYKETKEIFVLGKKIVRQPVREEGPFRFLKVKTYQVVARLMISQTIKGINRSMMHTMTFTLDKKEYQKIEPNRKYRVELAGNYIGKVFAPAPEKKEKKKGTEKEKGKEQAQEKKKKK
ncbi:hypothetical protein DNHGIG_07070 [Collibacillus ludicampi]|jgi:hypothetical protein|uniref:DUF2500 family protein n=1 Tax=Collibacillus ludicampi TaxID=2771369 RepID=A0AAV4LBI3_9BACL|nr:hypothetical protein [Collibacillus ludicampi]GIM45158.1 hypothetical protein DNHGIG_07070 [Collibacillus ludicampi]